MRRPIYLPELKIEILSRLGKVRLSRFEGKPAIEAYEILMPLFEEHCQDDKQKILTETFWYAKSLFTERKLEKARSVLESICPQVAHTEFEGNAIALLARTYLMQDKILMGVETLKGIPPEIRSPSIEFARGQALRDTKEYESAIKVLQLSLEDFGTADRAMASECLVLCGQCYAKLGQAEEGFRLMKEAIAANSDVYGKNHLYTYSCRGRLYESYLRFERYAEALEGFVSIQAELEATSAGASIRKLIPMCRIRVLACLAGLERYQEIWQELEVRPVDGNQLLDRERFELASILAIALTKTGRQSEVEHFIETRNRLNAAVPSDNLAWIDTRERVMQLLRVSGVRLD
ncbi:MAG: tetratricopeptide repeat protein [Pirellulales bacterium]